MLPANNSSSSNNNGGGGGGGNETTLEAIPLAPNDTASKTPPPVALAHSSSSSSRRSKRWKQALVNFGRSDNVQFRVWLPEEESPVHASTQAAATAASQFAVETEAIGWTKFETETLLELFKRFQGSIPVIVDRWPNELVPRTALELKERLYSMLPAQQVQHLILPDFATERARLSQVDALFAGSAAAATPLQDAAHSKNEEEEENFAKQHCELVQTIHNLQQEILTLRTQALPKPLVANAPTSRLEQRAGEDREEDNPCTNCWTRSNLLDPRFLQSLGRTASSTPPPPPPPPPASSAAQAAQHSSSSGNLHASSSAAAAAAAGSSLPPAPPPAGKETMLVVYEILNLLQVPMDPMPTQAVCEAHGALKRDTLKLLAFKRQIERMKKQPKLDLATSTAAAGAASAQPVPIEDLKRQMPDGALNTKRVKVGE